MPKKITEDDFIIIDTNTNLQALGTVKTSTFTTKKLGKLPFRLFAGLDFGQWYELGTGKLVYFDFKEHENMYENDPSLKKNSVRKDIKKRKLVRAKVLCPATLLEYYQLKDHSTINHIKHAELSYLSLFINPHEKILILDFKKGFFCYNVLYKNKDSDLTAITSSQYFILKYTDGNVKTVMPFEKTDVKYDTFFILGSCDVLSMLDFYQDNFHQVFIYIASRVYATQLFYFLFNSPLYVDVQMVDFFCREHQTNDNVHPIVRSNTGSGYVISASKVSLRLCNVT
jgi:hypothetical protein